MAGAIVQHVEAATTGATVSVTVAHPALNNVIVAWANSNQTVTTPTDNGSNSTFIA